MKRNKKLIKEVLGDWRGYPLAIVFVAIATWLKYLAQPDIIPADVPILYFLAIVPTAIFFGLGPSVLVCILSLLAFDYFFVFPIHTLNITHILNAPILLIFLAVGILFSYLSSSLREKNQIANEEIAARKQTETELVNYRDHLEDMIKQRTNELEKERQLLQTIMNSAGRSHLVYLDRDFNFIRVNITYANTCGYKPEEMIGKNHFALYPDIENEAIFTRVRDSGISEEYHDKPFEFPDQPNRGITYWDWTLIPVKNFQGQVEGLVFSLTETTERKKTEELLQASEKRYRSFIEVTGELGWVTNSGGEVVEDIPSFRHFTGQTDEEVKGWGWIKALHPDDVQHTEEIWTKAIKEKTTYEVEYRLRRHDGIYRYFLARGVPVFTKDGEVDEWVGTCIDITERKQGEKMLRESEQLLRDSAQRLNLAQEAANAGVWEWDLRTNRNFWSEEIWKLYGLDPHSVEPSYDAWAETIHPDDRPNVEKAVQEAADKGTRLSTEWRVIGHPGSERWLMSVGQPVLDDYGNITRYIGIVIDITERKQLEQMKDEFIGMVSHEIKTPITVIMGAIYTAMSEGIPQEDIRQLFEDAASSTESLSRIVDNLLELSRAQANRLVIRKEPVNIAETALDVVEKLKSQSTRHQLIVDMPIDLPRVSAERIRIERVLWNLIENAIKYSPDGGKVTIFAQPKDDCLVVGVQDMGVGISAEDQAKLFKPFQRLETTSGIAGVGLGLNVCRRLVEAHGGHMWVESEPGKGATFFFTMPLE
jgi:hypothetical protein